MSQSSTSGGETTPKKTILNTSFSSGFGSSFRDQGLDLSQEPVSDKIPPSELNVSLAT
jgi:hypothetical protein